MQGTSQDIAVNTHPSGASCVFSRQGVTIGTIQSTPATLSVPRRKYAITIVCDKPGYQTATYLNHSGLSGAVGGNIAADILLTGGLSSIIDSANGADNQYEAAVDMTLTPALAAAAPLPLAPQPAMIARPATPSPAGDTMD